MSTQYTLKQHDGGISNNNSLLSVFNTFKFQGFPQLAKTMIKTPLIQPGKTEYSHNECFVLNYDTLTLSYPQMALKTLVWLVVGLSNV